MNSRGLVVVVGSVCPQAREGIEDIDDVCPRCGRVDVALLRLGGAAYRLSLPDGGQPLTSFTHCRVLGLPLVMKGADHLQHGAMKLQFERLLACVAVEPVKHLATVLFAGLATFVQEDTSLIVEGVFERQILLQIG